MPIGPTQATETVPEFVAAYRAGRSLAEANAPFPAQARPETQAGWLILQKDAVDRAHDFKTAIGAIADTHQRACIAAACAATLGARATREERHLDKGEVALVGALNALNPSLVKLRRG